VFTQTVPAFRLERRVAATIVENVCRLGDRQASAVMTARPDVEWVDLSATKAGIHDALKDGRDWVLVCDGDIDHVLGSAHASDLLVRELEGHAIELRATVREAIFIPATVIDRRQTR